MCFYFSGLSQLLLRFRALFDLVQPEPCGFLPAVLGQHFVRRGRRLGKQRVKVHIIVIGVKVAGGIAIQLRQAAGTGQGDGCPQAERFQRRNAEPFKHSGVQKAFAILHQRFVLAVRHIAGVKDIAGDLGSICFGAAKGSKVLAAGHNKDFIMDRGVLYAVPHIRGGGEMGRAWYEQGRRLNKKHSFEDFVDATRALQKAHLADAWRTVANGGSAGGLLMGAIANMAPECYAGVEADVPFVDALTSILDPDLPLTVTEWDEWGDPLHDPEVYQYMKSYTPYENVPVAVLEGGNDEAAGDGSADGAATGAVAAAQFPRIFITTSMNDTRVLYVEPLKWLARLQSAGVDAVAKIEVEAGHGGLSGRYKQWEEVSYENAWCMDVMGLAH